MSFSRFTIFFIIAAFLLTTTNSQAQLWKRLKKRAEETIERKLEQKTEKETGEAMDEILEGEEPNTDSSNSEKSENSSGTNNAATGESGTPVSNNSSSSNNLTNSKIELYSKSEFVPGIETVFYDDFSQDAVGDFPVYWDTDFTGEVVEIDESPGVKWFKFQTNTSYMPLENIDFPENFTVEFDIFPINITKNTSAASYFSITFNDGTKFHRGEHSAEVRIPLIQYNRGHIYMYAYQNNRSTFSNNVPYDLRGIVNKKFRIGIYVQKTRYKMFINGNKVIDLPRFFPDHNNINNIIFYTKSLQTDEEFLLFSNFRVSKGKPDLRTTLFEKGKFTTDAIHFDVNSSNIKPESYSIIKQIADAINQEQGKKIQIIGHTDSDGDENSNLQLSKERAISVKNALVNDFGVDSSQILTDGKGESTPLVANDNSANKAKNRRVEFVIIQ